MYIQESSRFGQRMRARKCVSEFGTTGKLRAVAETKLAAGCLLVKSHFLLLHKLNTKDAAGGCRGFGVVKTFDGADG